MTYSAINHCYSVCDAIFADVGIQTYTVKTVIFWEKSMYTRKFSEFIPKFSEFISLAEVALVCLKFILSFVIFFHLLLSYS